MYKQLKSMPPAAPRSENPPVFHKIAVAVGAILLLASITGITYTLTQNWDKLQDAFMQSLEEKSQRGSLPNDDLYVPDYNEGFEDPLDSTLPTELE